MGTSNCHMVIGETEEIVPGMCGVVEDGIVPDLPGFGNAVMIDHHSIEVEVPEARSINDLIRTLENQGIVVERMRNKVNRLEELFIKMTTKDVVSMA